MCFLVCAVNFLCEYCARARNGHMLSKDELNLLCWAEQELDSFVRQDELFFGFQTQYYSEGCVQNHGQFTTQHRITTRLQIAEHLLKTMIAIHKITIACSRL